MDSIQEQLDKLVEQRARLSAQIGPRKQAGEDVTALIQESAKLSQRIKQIERELAAADEPEARSDANQLTVDIVTSAGEFEAMRDAWHQLEEDSDNFSVFMSWEWMYTWWEVFGAGKQLHIITVRDQDDKLVGLLPLMRVRKLAGLRRSEELTFIGTGARPKSDYLGLMAARRVGEASKRMLLDRLAADVADVGRAVLTGMAADQPCLREVVHSAALHGLVCTFTTEATAVNGQLPGCFEDLIETVPSKHRRSHLRRQEKKLSQAFHTVEYIDCRSQTDVSRFNAVLASFVNRRRRMRVGRSAWGNAAFCEFMDKVGERLLVRNILNLEILQLDGDPAAARLGFTYNGTFFTYQSGFQPRYGRYAPVHCLLSRRLRKLTAQGVKRFEFGRGVAPHKLEYFEGRTRFLRVRLARDEPRDVRRVACALWRDGAERWVKTMVSRRSGEKER